MKSPTLRIMFWSAVALIIPLFGNRLIEGWNWGPGEFVFAWVFFVVMATTIRLITKRFSTTRSRVIIGVAVFLIFAFIWIRLATG